MKNLYSNADGSVKLIEDAGVISLSFSEQLQLGGGAAAGIAKVKGEGSVVLDAGLGLKLGEALLNSHLPAAVLPLALVVEGIANQALSAME